MSSSSLDDSFPEAPQKPPAATVGNTDFPERNLYDNMGESIRRLRL
jgi:hypothetical protein